jgi:uncharacterized membrane protein
MNDSIQSLCSLWWIFPVLMMLFCVFMMKGRRGSTMCCFGSRRTDDTADREPGSALDILDRRYASGEIDREEYDEKKRTLSGPVDSGHK